MTALVVIIGVAVLMQGVLLVGLLRSHGEILRQLHRLGSGREEIGTPAAAAPADGHLSEAGVVGSRARDLAGLTPGGEAIAVAVAGSSHDTLLAFLSSVCLTCAGFWQVLGAGGELGLPQSMRVIAVTKSPGDESESAVARVAAAGVTVVMSTQAWLDYEVPGSPYFVHVCGSASQVRGEGTAATWDQVVGLVQTAHTDGLVHRAGMEGHIDDLHGGARIDEELRAAGIVPGDPRLYPNGRPAAGGES
jgi:hypothetical protein